MYNTSIKYLILVITLGLIAKISAIYWDFDMSNNQFLSHSPWYSVIRNYLSLYYYIDTIAILYKSTNHNILFVLSVCNCNGFADKCYFDRHLYNLTGQGGHCIDCRENRDGPNCERCKVNFYRREDDRCVPCDCNPTGR